MQRSTTVNKLVLKSTFQFFARLMSLFTTEPSDESGMNTHLTVARQYLSALERGVGRDELATFFTDDVVQEEFPNRLVPNGATRDLNALLEGNERGKQIMARQYYNITNIVEASDLVVLEVQWSGTLAHAVGPLAAGDTMHARFAVFLEFRDGKISAQRNYDCFEPW
ncbi:nuclear transport factor 2 family protein [Trichocoleus sp. FACHB-262]|uniref:nuclear transport factor 2 family protein n=1 Tax=Trichocoleus sp. FACHB-262 TaxID=2692869 RepID=UPI001A7EF373|nr:nuclear transport factor 2 family protein [Trichocoleus sp. FACHB-262]